MKAKIVIKEGHIFEVTKMLSKLLADEYILTTKTRNAHWNIEGKDFFIMHKFFEQQFRELDELVDSIAEQIRTLGHFAPATLKVFLELAQLSETTKELNRSDSLIKILLSDHEQIISFIRENIQTVTEKLSDLGTADFLTGLIAAHEKMAWMLRAHLKTKS